MTHGEHLLGGGVRERVRSMKLRPHATEAAALHASSRPPYVSAACKPSGMSTMELMPPMRCVSVRVRVRARARVSAYPNPSANPNPNPSANPNPKPSANPNPNPNADPNPGAPLHIVGEGDIGTAVGAWLRLGSG